MRRLMLGMALGIAVAALGMLGNLFVASPSAQQAGVIGRYEIVFSPHARTDRYLLDTETGRIWQPTSFTDLEGDPAAWVFQERIDDQQALDRWADAHPPKRR